RLYAVDAAPKLAGLGLAAAPVLVTLDAATGAVVRTDPLPTTRQPLHLIADRDGQHLHLLDGANVSTLDLGSRVGASPLGYPADVVDAFASWKHQVLLVANRLSRGVDLVWIGGRRISYTIPLDGPPRAMAANRAGTRLYLAVDGDP